MDTGRLAAIVTSMSNHAQEKIKPGPGSFNVLIGGKPAWRTDIDEHQCPEDGPEKVVHGAVDRVLVNNHRAVRMDDFLESSFGPPNLITWGNNARVEIGATEVGITTPDAIKEFCDAMCALKKDWPGLSPEERFERYKDIVGKQYDRLGVPRPNFELFDSNKSPGIGAWWAPGTWTMGLPDSTFKSATYPSHTMQDATFHEIRHSQQTYYALRSAAGRIKRGEIDPTDPGEPQNAEDLAIITGANGDVIQRAMENPLNPNTPEGRYGATQESASIKMAGKQRHGEILKNIWDASRREAEAKKKGDQAGQAKASQDLSDAADQYRRMPGGKDAQHAEAMLSNNCKCPP